MKKDHEKDVMKNHKELEVRSITGDKCPPCGVLEIIEMYFNWILLSFTM